jgi:hypothetical protein
MHKNIFTLCCVLLTSFFSVSNAQNKAKGVFASYHYSTMPNTDDLNAGVVLDYVTTFRFGGGVDYLNYLNNNFGIGTQLSFHQAGQDYSGLDTFSKYTMKASTMLNYLKGAFLVHYRTYNRYNPDQRFRAECFLGPYIALLPSFTDKIEFFGTDGKRVGGYTFDPKGLNYGVAGIPNIETKAPIYKILDYGFVIAPGVQFMITPKFALALNIRADISAVNVEATGNIGKKIAGVTNPDQEKYVLWDDLQNKYYSYPTTFPRDKYNQRPTTKNLTIGSSLTLRWYAQEQYMK